MRSEEHVERIRKIRNVYINVIGNSEGKRPLGIPRRRREDNINMDLKNRVRRC
jgi:hypothetical protein